jgi:hypothetical protein
MSGCGVGRPPAEKYSLSPSARMMAVAVAFGFGAPYMARNSAIPAPFSVHKRRRVKGDGASRGPRR